MSGTSQRTVTAPEKFVFDQPVDALSVRIVNGAVNVMGIEDGPARVEVTEIQGPPLHVRLEGSALTVTYDDLPWQGLLKWLDRKGRKRHAVVTLAVPAHTRVDVGVVGAAAVVSGIDGPTTVQGVNGDTTLVGLTGDVVANTVAGNVEAQSLSGDLRFGTVSGDLTVVEGSGARVRADSVSGSMVLDLDPAAGADVHLSSVSGDIAVRIPEPGDAEVEMGTTSGHASCDFDELHVVNHWGAKSVNGRIGAGGARLKASTLSGAVAVLRRPPLEDPAGPGSGSEPGSGSGPSSGSGHGSGPDSLRKDV